MGLGRFINDPPMGPRNWQGKYSHPCPLADPDLEWEEQEKLKRELLWEIEKNNEIIKKAGPIIEKGFDETWDEMMGKKRADGL
jgi:hypothetical protein